MTRYLFRLTLLGVLLLPDWASAFWWRRPAYVETAYYPCQPVYPVYTYPVCVPLPECCLPGYTTPLQPPRVEHAPKQATPGATPGMGMNPTRDNTKPTAPNPIRTVGANEPIPSQMPATAPTPKFPSVEIPKELGPLPKLDVPKEPDFRPVPAPKGNGFERPTTPMNPATPVPAPAPKNPTLVLPGAPSGGSAIPSPAPAFPEPLIPPTSVPVIPDPKQPETLPSLTLPPETPVAPTKETLTRSSPLTAERKAEPTVSVFPAQGAEFRADGYKAVGFYNHTDRDMNLTIEGRAVKLPARTYLHAMLGPTFTWGHGNQPAIREAVPAGAGGIDVVFRE